MDDLKRPVRTTRTSISIIEKLIQMDGATLSELVAEMDLASSTIHRHLATLQRDDLVMKRADEYRAGLRLLNMGVREQEQRPIFEAGKELVDRFAEDTGKRVWLSTIENQSCRTIYMSTNEASLLKYSQVGQRNPLHATAAGKTIIAELDDHEISRIIREEGIDAVTEQTITDADRLMQEIQQIRDQGYAISRGESLRGVEAIAVPINAAGELGAVGIGRSSEHHVHSLEEEYLDDLLETAGEIEFHLRA